MYSHTHQFTGRPFTKQFIKCTSIFKSNHTMFAMHVHSSYVMTEFRSLLGNFKRSNHGQPSFKLECESRANQTLVSHIVFFVLSSSFQRTSEKRRGWRMREERKRTIPKMNQTWWDCVVEWKSRLFTFGKSDESCSTSLGKQLSWVKLVKIRSPVLTEAYIVYFWRYCYSHFGGKKQQVLWENSCRLF